LGEIGWISELKFVDVLLEVFPETVSPLPGAGVDFSLPLIITEQGPEATGINMLGHKQNVSGVELKIVFELIEELPYAIQKLQKYGGVLVFGTVATSLPVSGPRVKGMAERQKIFFDEDGKSLERSIVGVEEELGQDGYLGGAIPSVRTMQENGNAMKIDVEGSLPGRVEDEANHLGPFGVFDERCPVGVVDYGGEANIGDFVVRVADCVYITDAKKRYGAERIIGYILVAVSCISYVS